MELALAKPVEGRLIRNPNDMAIVPGEGTVVKVDSFWRRREADGDITLEALKSQKAPKTLKKSESD